MEAAIAMDWSTGNVPVRGPMESILAVSVRREPSYVLGPGVGRSDVWQRLLTRAQRAPAAQPEGLTDKLHENPPAVFVSTTPAALVVTDGPPRYETVAGTSLQRLANSPSTVFLEPTDGEYYGRFDGHWYRAWTVDGRWQSIATNRLPADITKQVAR